MSLKAMTFVSASQMTARVAKRVSRSDSATSKAPAGFSRGQDLDGTGATSSTSRFCMPPQIQGDWL